MDNNEFIKEYQFEKGINCYYQLYNYHLFNKVCPTKIALNF